MSLRKFKIFWQDISQKIGIFLGIYLAMLPFLIVMSINSGIAIALVFPSIAIILLVLAMIPEALDEADRQIYYENQKTLDILKGD